MKTPLSASRFPTVPLGVTNPRASQRKESIAPTLRLPAALTGAVTALRGDRKRV